MEILNKNAKKILLVEDYELISKAYFDGLTRAGFNVFLLNNGLKVVESIKKNKPDLVLLDVIMPERDGFEVLKELNKEENIEKPPIIVMSNLCQEAYQVQAYALGITDYLIKSDYTVKEVVDIINKTIFL